ncbi:FkbM family methyltransferase [Vibrio cionasavignyae]|uniref:FkbM family methyltransferase n=1 Tax=Vibrio cionasavignyae TaxID=2910252 RepID=UPI003D0C80BC
MINKIINRMRGFNKPNAKSSYSQCGEDMIVAFVFEVLGIDTPFYVDIGAHNSEFINNTKYFYDKGATGINIEPDPSLYNSFCKGRARDINLNIGIGLEKSEMNFYRMNASALNTFCKETAYSYAEKGKYEVEEVIKVNVDTINSVFNQYCNEKGIDFLSVDVEGHDESIIRSIDYSRYSPKVIIVETAEFSESGVTKKNTDIGDFLLNKGYFLYGDTNINSIFVLRSLWESR